MWLGHAERLGFGEVQAAMLTLAPPVRAESPAVLRASGVDEQRALERGIAAAQRRTAALQERLSLLRHAIGWAEGLAVSGVRTSACAELCRSPAARGAGRSRSPRGAGAGQIAERVAAHRTFSALALLSRSAREEDAKTHAHRKMAPRLRQRATAALVERLSAVPHRGPSMGWRLRGLGDPKRRLFRTDTEITSLARTRWVVGRSARLDGAYRMTMRVLYRRQRDSAHQRSGVHFAEKHLDDGTSRCKSGLHSLAHMSPRIA